MLALDGSSRLRTLVWNGGTGRWTFGARLPEALGDLRVGELADGRVVAAGVARGTRRARAYVADEQLRSWSLFVDGPDNLAHPILVPTPSGVLLFTGERAWRFKAGTDGWRPVPLPFVPAMFPSLRAWGDEVLLTWQQADRWSASSIEENDGAAVSGRVAIASASVDLNVVTALGANMWFVASGAGKYLWRSPSEPLLRLADLVPLSSHIVAVDEEHLLAATLAGAIIDVALDGIPPPGRACDGLLRYLSRHPSPVASESDVALVSEQCREQARQGAAPELAAVLQSWAADPEHADVGRSFACALHDSAAVPQLPRWFSTGMGDEARATCYRSLATWPEANGVWALVLDTAVYERSDGWRVDPALIRVASTRATPALRERLVPVLRAAAVHKAGGFDALRNQVCVDDAALSGERRRACAELREARETDWRSQQAGPTAGTSRGSPLARRMPRIIAGTLVFAGAVGGAYATRDGNVSRAIAVGSGALGGAALGFSVVALSSLHGHWVSKTGQEVPPLLYGGMLVGAVVGGVAAYFLTPSPWSRAPVTAGALAFPYFLTLTVDLD